ncbi:MAG TPA: hypothetical protein VMF65_22030 [Acidimicrobiales bacterium]|nr:hypothetical protein [Acidimicrobiales bacterium]
MSGDLLGQGSRLPAATGVELAGMRQWVRSLLVMPGLFVVVVVVCALAGATDWATILIVMSALTVVFEALLVRNGVTSLVVSPGAVVRRNRRRTTTVRAEEVNDILIKHMVNGPVMIISAGPARVGLLLRVVYRKRVARDVLASFLRRAGVDLASLRGLGLPVPVLAPRTVAGPILSRPDWPAPDCPAPDRPAPDRPAPDRPASGPPATGRRRLTPVRAGGRALAWVTLAAFALVAAVGVLRIFY